MTVSSVRGTIAWMEPTTRSYASAAEVRAHLSRLLCERLEANACGLADCDAYMADLAGEIAECRAAFVATAVTEIAVLRAELSAPLMG
jgi:hypothetical protein